MIFNIKKLPDSNYCYLALGFKFVKITKRLKMKNTPVILP